jgi:type 2 lantibiotic biosynthesis protein LanM
LNFLINNRDFLNASERIGKRLCTDALWSGDFCNWAGDAMSLTESGWRVTRRALGPDVYSGTSGIALFLSYLFSCVPEQDFKKTAEGAIRYALSHSDRLNSGSNFGFYSGLTGIAYALAEMAKIFGAPNLAEQSLTVLRELLPLPTNLRRWDIISGSAGVIPVFLNLHGVYKDEFLLDLAIRHGDMLLQSASRGEEGWSWSGGENQPHNNLTGFSHGTAGVAWSLLELHRKSGNQRFLTAAQEALRYERHWYSPQWENWPDFRTSSETGDPGYVAGWCHGAPGIGLSRVRAFQLLGDQDCRTEAEIAVRTTTKVLNSAVSHGQGNYSLCHGHCGNAELLICADDVLGDQGSIQAVHLMAEDALQKYHVERNPWPCGVQNAGETPDLMLGLAGIGHFFLRLYDRQKIPSILLVGPNPPPS